MFKHLHSIIKLYNSIIAAKIRFLKVLVSIVNFLGYFAKMSSCFSMKTTHRYDVANGKYLTIFLRAFARIVRVTHVAQVISFREFHVKN